MSRPDRPCRARRPRLGSSHLHGGAQAILIGVGWLRFPRLVGVVVVVYLLLVSGYFGFETVRRSQFVADAASTTGVVAALRPRPLAGTTRVHTLGDDVPQAPEVRYLVNGTTYTYTPAHGLIGSPIAVGDTVEVLYDPAHPAHARLRHEGQLLLPAITAGFAAAAVGVLAMLVVTRDRDRANQPAPTPVPPSAA